MPLDRPPSFSRSKTEHPLTFVQGKKIQPTATSNIPSGKRARKDLFCFLVQNTTKKSYFQKQFFASLSLVYPVKKALYKNKKKDQINANSNRRLLFSSVLYFLRARGAFFYPIDQEQLNASRIPPPNSAAIHKIKKQLLQHKHISQKWFQKKLEKPTGVPESPPPPQLQQNILTDDHHPATLYEKQLTKCKTSSIPPLNQPTNPSYSKTSTCCIA